MSESHSGRSLASEIASACEAGASDLHLEPGCPAARRIDGRMISGGRPLPAPVLSGWARQLLGKRLWPSFVERRSADLAATVAGVRCRFNVLRTQRGVGFAIRLLPAVQPSLDSLNLHPDLAEIAREGQGLVLVSGPTGSGKSSTIAAMVHEINRLRSVHVLTLEQPVEFQFRPRKAFVRQREVGRDTPSFEQGLRDALREDPDVLVVGELRHPEVMQLALEAAETGHLVLSTMHAGSVAEVLQRLVGSLPPQAQTAAAAQLAQVLRAVVCQRLVPHPDLDLRLPWLEILRASSAVSHLIRQGDFFKLPQAMEVGHADGHWTSARYRQWMDQHVGWEVPDPRQHSRDEAPLELDSLEVDEMDHWAEDLVESPPGEVLPERDPAPRTPRQDEGEEEDVIVLDPEISGSLSDVISELEGRRQGPRPG